MILKLRNDVRVHDLVRSAHTFGGICSHEGLHMSTKHSNLAVPG